MSQIKLYGFLFCPYVHRVRFALNSLKIKYDYFEIDLLRNLQKSEAYLKINPLGKVPSIDINNEIIYESLPLLEFIENEFGGVFPKDNVRQAQQRIWANYFDQNVISKMWGIFTLIKTKDQEGAKQLAQGLVETLRFFTQHSKLSEKVRRNPSTFFEGENLSYVDYAVVPHIRFLERFFTIIFKLNLFEGIEDDEYIKDFKTYYNNVVASPAYQSITDELKDLPTDGENQALDELRATTQQFDYNQLFEIYLNLRRAQL